MHNYGHGGSGLTLAPDSTKYVIDLLETEIGTEAKKRPIVMISGGVIGLFTALELKGRGYTNVTV